MKRRYQIVRTFVRDARQKLDRFLAKEGQLWLLPMLDLIETGQVVVDQFIDVGGSSGHRGDSGEERREGGRAYPAGEGEGPGRHVLVRWPAGPD